MVRQECRGRAFPVFLCVVWHAARCIPVRLVRSDIGGIGSWGQFVSGVDETISVAMSWRFLRTASRMAMRGRLDLTVSGLEHVPESGPTVIAARHYHHLWDGCALLTAIPWHTHVLVAADWAGERTNRRVLEAACAYARWPVVLRTDAVKYRPDLVASAERRAAYGIESGQYLRRAARESIELLRDGHCLIMFPEGYPTIDPRLTPKQHDDEVMPFQPGFARMVAMAQEDGRTQVPVIPAGLEYARVGDRRWRLQLRFGEQRILRDRRDVPDAQREIERDVRRLSGLPETG